MTTIVPVADPKLEPKPATIKFQVVWIRTGDKSVEIKDVLMWDSRDMAQLSALLFEGPEDDPRAFSGYRIDEVKV